MFKIITLPFNRNLKGFDEDLLNGFAAGKHVRRAAVEFFEDAGEKYWTVFIEYEAVMENGSSKQEETLSESEKVLFERLRQWRKERADKEGVPVFLIGTNSEFADIIKSAPTSLEALKTIRGFGKGKVAKYGPDIINLIKAFNES